MLAAGWRILRAFSTRQKMSLDQLRKQPDLLKATEETAKGGNSVQPTSNRRLNVSSLTKPHEIYNAFYTKADSSIEKTSLFCRLLQLTKLNQSLQKLQTKQFVDMLGWIDQNASQLNPESLVYVLETVSRLPKTELQRFYPLARSIAKIFREQGAMQLISSYQAMKLLKASFRMSSSARVASQFRKLTKVSLTRVLPELHQTKTLDLLKLLTIATELQLDDRTKIKPLCEQLLARKKYLKVTDLYNVLVGLVSCQSLTRSFREVWKETDLMLRTLYQVADRLNSDAEPMSVHLLVKIIRLVRADKSGRFAAGRLEYFNDMLLEKCWKIIDGQLRSASAETRRQLDSLYQLIQLIDSNSCSPYIEALISKRTESCFQNIRLLGFNTQVVLMWLSLTKRSALGGDLDWSKCLIANSKYNINSSAAEMVVELADHPKAAEVYNSNEAYKTYVKLSLSHLMKCSREFASPKAVSSKLRAFCLLSPTFPERLRKQLFKGLKVNAQLTEQLVDYLQYHHTELEAVRKEHQSLHPEALELRKRLQNILSTASLATLLYQPGQPHYDSIMPEVSRLVEFGMSQVGFDGLLSAPDAALLAALEVYFSKSLVSDCGQVDECPTEVVKQTCRELWPQLKQEDIHKRMADRTAAKTQTTSESE